MVKSVNYYALNQRFYAAEIYGHTIAVQLGTFDGYLQVVAMSVQVCTFAVVTVECMSHLEGEFLGQ
jgi:hypothetical protein